MITLKRIDCLVDFVKKFVYFDTYWYAIGWGATLESFLYYIKRKSTINLWQNDLMCKILKINLTSKYTHKIFTEKVHSLSLHYNCIFHSKLHNEFCNINFIANYAILIMGIIPTESKDYFTQYQFSRDTFSWLVVFCTFCWYYQYSIVYY